MNNKSASFTATWGDPRVAIALGVLVISIVGLLMLATVVIIYDPAQAKSTMSTLLPVLGTWVGTILAFYFARENFESASRSVRDMAEKITGIEALQKIPVMAAMILLKSMKYLQLTSAKPTDQLKLVGDILPILGDKNRLPILDENNHPQYMIHKSLINKFIAEQSITPKTPPVALNTLTLKDLLENSPDKNMFKTGFGTVKEDANLSEAKDEMEKADYRSDIFITKDGTSNSPVIGWLTNLIISEKAGFRRS